METSTTTNNREFRKAGRLLVSRYQWTRLYQLDRWLGRIKTHIQRFGGLPPSGPDSRPTAVLAVRAATQSAKGWIEIRS